MLVAQIQINVQQDFAISRCLLVVIQAVAAANNAPATQTVLFLGPLATHLLLIMEELAQLGNFRHVLQLKCARCLLFVVRGSVFLELVPNAHQMSNVIVAYAVL